MPTDEERREVAARLRRIEIKSWHDGIDEVCALEDACGCSIGQDWQDIELKDRLADLIEPEPERTCRWKHIEGTWFMSECGERYDRVIPDNYCPNCGARVVS